MIKMMIRYVMLLIYVMVIVILKMKMKMVLLMVVMNGQYVKMMEPIHMMNVVYVMALDY